MGCLQSREDGMRDERQGFPPSEENTMDTSGAIAAGYLWQPWAAV